MHCTVKKTLQIVLATGNDVLVQLKGNQPKLLATLSEWARGAAASTEHQATQIGQRNRIESRHTTVWMIPAGVLDQDWSGVCCLIRVQRNTQLFDTTLQNWRERTETAWAISTRRLAAEAAAQAIRGHWLIENALHHVRDVALVEDASRIRKQPGVFAQLRTWALNLLRGAGYENIKAARQTLGWSPEALLRLCSG